MFKWLILRSGLELKLKTISFFGHTHFLENIMFIFNRSDRCENFKHISRVFIFPHSIFYWCREGTCCNVYFVQCTVTCSMLRAFYKCHTLVWIPFWSGMNGLNGCILYRLCVLSYISLLFVLFVTHFLAIVICQWFFFFFSITFNLLFWTINFHIISYQFWNFILGLIQNVTGWNFIHVSACWEDERLRRLNTIIF